MNTQKISLDESKIQEILKLYEDGFNRLEIAKKLNMTEWAVRKNLKPAKNRGERLRSCHKNKSTPLSYLQEQLILGSLLGDASLSYRSKNDTYDFQVSHCLEQKEYIQYKADILNKKILSYIKDDNSYSAGKEYFKCNFNRKYELEQIYKMCFVDSKKKVTLNWASKINAQAIAIWFCDDGTTSFSKNAVICRFSTLSFDVDELQILQNRLLELGIETSLQFHQNGKNYIIAVRQKSINDFMDLIEPFIIPCMQYKIKRKNVK